MVVIINISRENDETVSFNTSAIYRTRSSVCADYLGAVENIRHIPFLEGSDYGLCILCNRSGSQ